MEQALHQVPFGEQPMDVDFHPTQSLLATGLIDGHLLVHSYSAEAAEERSSMKAHSGTCRAVRFTLAGDLLISGSADQSLLAVDVETGKATARKKEAHDNAINRLAAVGATLTASGDDAGVIKLWDSRQTDAVASFDAHDDFVTDMSLHEREGCLLSVSGDGTLSVIDLRTNKVKATSEGEADDELLSVVAIKNGKKLVCGSQSGVLNVWSWGFWNDCSDRFPGHPESVDALLKYDEDTVLTGSSDGLIRVVSLQPNKMLGVLGEHADFPIERMAMSSSRAFLASASHDNTVKIWDLAALEDDDEEDEEEEEEGDANEEEEAEQAERAAAGASSGGEGERAASGGGGGGAAGPRTAAAQEAKPAAAKAKAAAGSDSDADSDSDSDAPAKKKRKKGAHRIPSKQHHKQRGTNFFADLL